MSLLLSLNRIGRRQRQAERMEKELGSQLERSWRATCKVIFGQETGSLGEYGKWLEENLPPAARRKSHISGKEVIVARDAYPQGALFVSNEELKPNRDYAISINDMKDLDSIARALSETCEYTGNRVLGSSSHVESSDIVMDSHFVANSTNIEESAYVFSSYMIRKGSKHIFGSGYMGKSEFILSTVGTFNSKRCLGCSFVPDCSDTYYSHNCFGSHDMMFCFGQRNASYRIGNLQLPREKYRTLKAKLVSEMAEELGRKRRLPSLVELVPKEAPDPLPPIKAGEAHAQSNMAAIEKGFASTYALAMKRQPSGIANYSKWLSEGTVSIKQAKSAFGGTNYYPDKFAFYWRLPDARRVNFDELLAASKLEAEEREAGSLEGMRQALGRIGFFTAELFQGENANYIESPLVYHGTNIYRTYDVSYGDHAGVCFLALNSKHVYGCYRILESQFSLKCYNSLYLNRCFEMDSCNKCADSYFCHNSEALQDAMFCFNAKGMRNAIGNTQLSKEEYAKAKERLVSQMADEIAKSGRLKWNIYNVGARK